MYTIYSLKNKKLGNLLGDGTLDTSNKTLKDLYNTMLNMGVLSYSLKHSKKKIEVIRTNVTQTDGDIFVLAIVDHLKYLGFTIKEDN